MQTRVQVQRTKLGTKLALHFLILVSDLETDAAIGMQAMDLH
jgi:hypothetical protein